MIVNSAVQPQFQDHLAVLPFGVASLRLEGFRNYVHKKIILEPLQSVVITGPNGSGKTNILEAISWLSPGRGLKRAALSEVLNADKRDQLHGWAVAATITNHSMLTDIGTGGLKDPATGEFRRVLHIDHKAVKTISQLNQYLTVQWLTPDMDRLLSGPSSERRQFLDRLVYAFDNAHAQRVTQYEVALRERLRLLKNGQHDNHWLASLEQKLAELSVAISASRLEYIEAMNRHNNSWGLSEFPSCTLNLAGVGEQALLQGTSATHVEMQMQQAFAADRGVDGRVGMTHSGAHRTDFQVTYNLKKVSASQCSTGEQKACLLTIIFNTCALLVHQNKPNPLVLLDEVIAHLDSHRRQQLFETLKDLKIQAWMTGTDRAMFEQGGCEAHYEDLKSEVR